MATQITDKIWIGNSYDANHPPEGITGILNCAFDLFNDAGWNRGIHLAHCGLVDGPGNPLKAYQSAIDQLWALLEFGRTVLVHCHKGESRSVAVVIGYLQTVDHKGWEYWRSFIRSKRPTPDHTPHPALKELFGKIYGA